LNGILSHAVRRGYISENPVLRLERHERPRHYRRERRGLNHDEIARLLACCLSRYRPFLASALYTGMRLSELLCLSWQDVDFDRRGLGQAATLAHLNPADQPRLRVHDLRHTFASHLIIDLKLDVAQVSRVLGHARPSITLDTYTHLFNHAGHADDIRQRMARS